MPTKGHIPEEIIDDIRHQADIVDIISEYVSLNHAGKNYKGLCPFHQEKTPSFVVNPAKQIFKCYGCGVGGNVFTFLMHYEQYSFPEAVKFLAARLGIALPSVNQQSSKQLRHQDALYQLHQDTARYFSKCLNEHAKARPVRAYLEQRGVHDESIATFSLGYALPEWDDLFKALRGKYPPELLAESGLILKRKQGVGFYDRFRDRLMIPIHDARGRIVAFGGRIMGEGEPKYLNSPETAIFQKGSTLFGLYHAKDAIRRSGQIMITEGYFDMLIPYSFGVKQVVATMGTSLTENHIRLIRRYARTVLLMFDADPAGMKAVLRTLDMFLPSGLDVRAVMLPQGEDPDTAIRTHGVEGFQRYIADAVPLVDFVRERIVEQYDLSQVSQQVACANQLLPIIVKIPDMIERGIQINRTADLLKISDTVILREFKRVAESGKTSFTPAIPTGKRAAMPLLEQYLLKALCKDKRLIPEVQRALDVEKYIRSPLAKYILKELFVYHDKTDFESKMLDSITRADIQRELSELFMRAEEIVDPVRTVHDCLEQLTVREFEHITKDTTRKVRDAQEKKKRESLDAFLEQKNRDLLRKKAELEKKKTQ